MNIILDKSFAFAVRIVKLHQHLIQEQKTHELAKQLLRSGTSIGANAEESVGGHSKRDFVFKMEIAQKEARETRYWLRLLRECGYIEDRMASSLLQDCEELIKIITSICVTTKRNMT